MSAGSIASRARRRYWFWFLVSSAIAFAFAFMWATASAEAGAYNLTPDAAVGQRAALALLPFVFPGLVIVHVISAAAYNRTK